MCSSDLAAAGIGGTGSSQPVTNTWSKNNIYHLYKANGVAYNWGTQNVFASDLYNGHPGEAVYTNGMQGTPVYAAGNGATSGAGGMYQLASTSPGFGKGAKIANFNDGVAAPDVGAHQSGTSAMKFGVAGSAGSAVGGAGTGTGTTTPPPTSPPTTPPPAPTGFTLTVGKTGTGTGTVRTTDALVNCGAKCSNTYATAKTVTLTATPAYGSVFMGWSGGGCSGRLSCTTSVNVSKTVTANFLKR